MTVRLLHSSELSPIRQRHELDTEFGIRTSWEYRNKAGQTVWAVAANYPSLIFTDKCSDNHSPQILGYQMVNDHQLVIAADRYEETFRLEEDNRRLRELRFVGKLIQRIWEDRFEP
ncbi:MAG: hypothetical protein HC847_01685 [Hydrococcus sp. RU_2_2]|nr:hypothetical protein [Hydrococcus sp. RU_2_2]